MKRGLQGRGRGRGRGGVEGLRPFREHPFWPTSPDHSQQIPFWPIHFWPKLVFSRFHNLCGSRPIKEQQQPEQSAQTQKKWGPERWGPRRLGSPKIRVFFPSPAAKFVLSSLSWGVFSWNFGGVFEGRGVQTCTFGVLWLSCETPAAPKPRADASVVHPFVHCCSTSGFVPGTLAEKFGPMVPSMPRTKWRLSIRGPRVIV